MVGSLSSLFSSCLEFRLRDGGRVGSQRTVLNQWVSELRNYDFPSHLSIGFCSVSPDVMQISNGNPSGKHQDHVSIIQV